ncbi:periplasmic sensor signal transduction histidine kinase 3 [Isoalcanivorax pacificus W11-5]|uniref:histidine kinase n=1 Tax=Isoalcanivorax pacificus W11-5 TaxID=391936 RepID=A0A0B4XMF5_9GAMM|nr:ATP-binding protein [Isoalcanivorax pacificus]AJD49499.1 periplasmic sensor signal transduction histidine kinase 3 [Isoalcanivorax pacificus W11-5]
MLLAGLATPVAADDCRTRLLDIAAAPEQPGSAQPPTDGWVKVALPDTWFQRWPGHDGAVWYRLRWHDGCHGKAAIAVAVSHVTMAGSLLINDTLLWRDAHLQEPFSRSWNMPRYWVLPRAALNADGDNTLWFRVVGMRHDVLGLGQVDIGDPATIWPLHTQQVWQKRDLFTLNMSISLVLGCLFLSLWAVQRSERAFGWYALASLSWALFAHTMLATSPWPFTNSADWNRAVTLVLTIYCSAFCLFTWHFGGQRFPRLSRALPGITLCLTVTLWWIPDDHLTPVLMAVIPGYTLVFIANCIQFQFHAWLNRQRHNVLLALCLLSFLVIATHDLLVVLTVIGGEHIYAPIASPISMLFMFLIIADRFASNLRHIKAFNTELKTAISHTSAELTRTLQHQHQLESRNIRLTERLRLSHDLHDSLGSSLMRSIAVVEQSGEQLGSTRFLSMLKELRSDLRQIIDNSAGSAVTHTTPSAWIAPLRHRFVRLFEELGLTSTWQVPADWPRALSSIPLLTLTRFIEEALTNAIKHSRGDHFQVQLHTGEDGILMLEVSDNGIGFDVEAVSDGSGVGMHSMRTRIERIGGQLTITSVPGETRLTVHLALPPPPGGPPLPPPHSDFATKV